LNILRKCELNGTSIINKLTKDCVHPIILSINSKNPIFLTQVLLAEDCIDCEYIYMENNVLHYIVKSNVPLKIKNTLFKNCVSKNFDLLEECKIDKKPLVVKAVESDLYEIVIMIINKLLEKEEIKFDGYDNLKDIRKLLLENKYPNIIVKNRDSPNFYSLVMMYLKSAKHKLQPEIEINMKNFIENLFVMMCVILVYLVCLSHLTHENI
jgi:hypothetical protein